VLIVLRGVDSRYPKDRYQGIIYYRLILYLLVLLQYVVYALDDALVKEYEGLSQYNIAN
jgi:hypothetical protein